jgi:hypothetical protein
MTPIATASTSDWNEMFWATMSSEASWAMATSWKARSPVLQ